MLDGRRLIPTPFTGSKKLKSIMVKEKHIPVKRRQSSVETDRGSYRNKGMVSRIFRQ